MAVSNLPSPKGAALAIMELCRREEVTLAELAKLVQTDPALCSRLLRLANSARFAMPPVAAAQDAIMRLGMTAVRQLAMGFSLVDQYLDGPCAAFDYQRFWSHSLLMAIASQEFAATTRIHSPDEMFACGLLARIGCLALATMYPHEYAAILDCDAAERTRREREELELDHNELTATILQDCGMPSLLVEAAACHEDPDAVGFSEGSQPHAIARLMNCAMWVADMGLAEDAQRYDLALRLKLLAGKMGLDEADLTTLVDRCCREWREWAKILNVPAEVVPAFDTIASTRPPGEYPGASSMPLTLMLLAENATDRDCVRNLSGEFADVRIIEPSSPEHALASVLELNPQIILLDLDSPASQGAELCRALRATEWGQSVYLLAMIAREGDEEADVVFELGADDYVLKPLRPRSLKTRVKAAAHHVKLLRSWEKDRAQLKQFAAELAISNRRLQHAALTDLLTGVANRRAGMQELEKAWSASDRSRQPLSVMMIDIDRFKSINDMFGHAAGDLLLKAIAATIQNTARRDDSVCRMGGEEFLVTCHNTDLEAASHSAARIIKAVRALKVDVGETEVGPTVSIGLAAREPNMRDTDVLINAADKALYEAKRLGRDQVCVSVRGRLREAPHQH